MGSVRPNQRTKATVRKQPCPGVLLSHRNSILLTGPVPFIALSHNIRCTTVQHRTKQEHHFFISLCGLHDVHYKQTRVKSASFRLDAFLKENIDLQESPRFDPVPLFANLTGQTDALRKRHSNSKQD